ncbi:MAG TPA: gamma-glutamyl-gamma-aminobutyrate hydrolase family protein [Firmicutes bacterium]|nr:gamma-glutamyl-gamma-aminobutyrate hydrolase family protein [Bacillota bacterium]
MIEAWREQTPVFQGMQEGCKSIEMSDMSYHPLIGISCSFERRDSQDPGRDRFFLNADYGRAITAAGAIPVIIPHVSPEDRDGDALKEHVDMILQRLDGILLSGGGDIDPAFYGESRHPRCGSPDKMRDELELLLARRAVSLDLPLLAICRGIQVLNVAFGGTLFQDIPDQISGASRHDFAGTGSREDRAHRVRVMPGSLLGKILSCMEESKDPGMYLMIEVNSFHHQAVKRLAPGFNAIAFSEKDEIIEAIEARDKQFCLGVQWHPEAMIKSDEPARRIFEAFARAATAFGRNRQRRKENSRGASRGVAAS